MDVVGSAHRDCHNKKSIAYNILVFLMRSESRSCSLGDVCGSNPELTVWEEMTALLLKVKKSQYLHKKLIDL